MPQYIQVGNDVIEFPDGMSDAEIAAVLSGQTQQEPKPQPEKRGLGEEVGRQLGLTGRAVYEAFTSPATTVLDAASAAYNLGAKALGSSSRLPSFSGQQSQMLNKIGVPQPESAVERAVQAGTQAMAGTAGLAKAAPNVAAFTKDLGRQVASSGAAGAVAQPTAEVVTEITDSPLIGTLAAVGLGAVTAAGSGKLVSALERGDIKLQTPSQIRQRASANYAKLDESGITIKPESLQTMRDNVGRAIREGGLVEGTAEATAFNSRLAELDTILRTNQPVDFRVLERSRRVFNDLKASQDKNVSRLASTAVTEIDKYITKLSGRDVNPGRTGIDDAVKIVTQARKDWRNAARADVLQDALDVAEVKALNPSASESELIRRGFINIAANKQKMSLFSKEEQNIIKSVASGGALDPLLSAASKFSPFRSQLAAGGAVGGTVAGLPQVALPLAGMGMAADAIQGALRSQAANRAVNTIASGAARPQPENLRLRGALAGGLFTNLEEQQ